jgi:hypothetical protein
VSGHAAEPREKVSGPNFRPQVRKTASVLDPTEEAPLQPASHPFQAPFRQRKRPNRHPVGPGRQRTDYEDNSEYAPQSTFSRQNSKAFSRANSKTVSRQNQDSKAAAEPFRQAPDFLVDDADHPHDPDWPKPVDPVRAKQANPVAAAAQQDFFKPDSQDDPVLFSSSGPATPETMQLSRMKPETKQLNRMKPEVKENLDTVSGSRPVFLPTKPPMTVNTKSASSRPDIDGSKIYEAPAKKTGIAPRALNYRVPVLTHHPGTDVMIFWYHG